MLSLETSIGIVADSIPKNVKEFEKDDLEILGSFINKSFKAPSSLWVCNNLDKAAMCYSLAAQFVYDLKKENIDRNDKIYLKRIFALGYLCASKYIKANPSSINTLIHRFYLISSCKHVLNELLEHRHPYDFDLEEENDQTHSEIVGPSICAVDSLIFADLHPIKDQLEKNTPPQSQIIKIDFNIIRSKYGQGIFADQMLRIGKLNHNRLYEFLSWKIITENNLNFSNEYNF